MTVQIRDKSSYIAALLTLKNKNHFPETPYMLDFRLHIKEMIEKVFEMQSDKLIVCFIEYNLESETRYMIEEEILIHDSHHSKKFKFCL